MSLISSVYLQAFDILGFTKISNPVSPGHHDRLQHPQYLHHRPERCLHSIPADKGVRSIRTLDSLEKYKLCGLFIRMLVQSVKR